MNITDIAREAGIGDSHGYFIANYAEQIEAFAAAIKAAHLAELLAGVEMPEPVAWISKHGHMQGNHENLAKRHADEYTAHKDWKPLVTLDQCQQAVAAAVARERQRILQCYSPDDTVNDYQDKIRSGK